LTISNPTYYGGRLKALLFPVMDLMGRAFGALKFGESAAYGFILTALIVSVTALQFALRKKN
jgi:multiple sugar transport system permease protein